MKSMTGFGRAAVPLGRATLALQVSSVNRKTLDLTVSLPDAWEALEPEILEKVRACAVRGKVHAAIELTRPAGTEGPAWDEAALTASLERLAALAAAKGIAFVPTPELLWQIAQSSRKDSDIPDLDTARPVLLAALDQALQGFSEMRAKRERPSSPTSWPAWARSRATSMRSPPAPPWSSRRCASSSSSGCARRASN